MKTKKKTTSNTPRASKLPNSFRLTEAALETIRTLSERLGVSQAAVIEMAVRQMAEPKIIQGQ